MHFPHLHIWGKAFHHVHKIKMQWNPKWNEVQYHNNLYTLLGAYREIQLGCSWVSGIQADFKPNFIQQIALMNMMTL